jgi:hypothetical protein
MADVSTAEVAYDAQGRMTSSFLNQQSSFRSLGGTQNEVCVAHLEPPGETGVDRIEATFEVSEQRVLLVTVKDLLTDRMLVERGVIAKLQ